ncbi:glycosyl transferase family 4-domain-containing protein [Gamsiella multidivaricata]|uniref:glycosyl transferase family 4-domain-containing protein n=1 Tax=Gamsiella multidivaricata TaxID=101098 RepID=UPI00221FFEB1|nr:glycosyl transferase family 4-domain-containing protein [Gamsiella multidivaricata]KAG0369949.1 UDP-N-acetylglucosamine--dolichyl-phosphate N-acetylglucosaminephosphotransferase [Gamsiella multidivaricata]KAI7820643.1 glycosyl transferase family 4-domain-containing protein [Gamsiella multidivaricata]
MGQISALTAWLILAAEVGAVFIILTTAHDPLTVNVGFSILAGITTWSAIPALSEIFIKAGLKGIDLSKKTKHILPESMGMVAGLIYLVIMFLFIPFPFMKWFTASRDGNPQELTLLTFPNLKLAELLSALLSIQSMVFLGFADDVLDIRWRFKMPLPAIASIPLLMVYWVNSGVTYIVVPIPLRPILGQLVDLGVLYYVYMGMVAIFCTHSINIMAGINGVEVGQSLVIACSIAINDMLFLQSSTSGAPAIETHLFSLYFIMPFIGVSIGLLLHNWYPSKVFIGDTYCYFAGMTFAVVGILAHYSKTLLLFFIPQIFNFLLSAPQLFRLVPCPRHRVPRYNRGTNLMEASRVVLDQEALDAESTLNGVHSLHHSGEQKQLQQRQSPVSLSTSANDASGHSTTAKISSPLLLSSPKSLSSTKSQNTPLPASRISRPGWYCIKLLELLGLTHVRYDARTGQRPLEMTNLTILNLILLKAGPMSERSLTISVMLVQVICSIVAFFIRYRLVAFVYDVVS